jgi:hypothetical protein
MIICCGEFLFWSSLWCPGGFLYPMSKTFSGFGKLSVIIFYFIQMKRGRKSSWEGEQLLLECWLIILLLLSAFAALHTH